ncbi:hypothetical protein BN946_scf184980.g13 [Trametes cinnabarina]|uniref:Ergosterol biosynthetic protein 28 n=1 Tax=Pycnoporus cinnabarinus TaxID=5643 RepID=A0A060SD81_PYCCI|nr:hypothetical protein BN946_scf184980.g13 [Trametes cinnabarina]
MQVRWTARVSCTPLPPSPSPAADAATVAIAFPNKNYRDNVRPGRALRFADRTSTLLVDVEDLPQGPGWLPTWQLIVAVTATLNTIGSLTSVAGSRRLYNNAPAFVNPLQSRTFAIWTLTSAVVRFYAAYNINNKLIYDLALFTYLFAFFHFGSELMIFRTARPSPPNMSPVVVSTTSLVWMLTQYNFYVRT